MKTKIIFILSVFITSVVSGQSRTQNFDSLFKYLNTQNDFNGNILIAEQGKIIYKKSLGYSDFSTKKNLNKNTMFNIASLSKQFTAVGILLLRDQKKLQLDDELTEYFPLLPYKNITIRNLLTHTSGIPDYMDLFDKHWDKSKIATNNDVINLLVKYQPKSIFKPNEKYEYSNTGYVILGSIIEKVSGLSYAEFLKKNIFIPLKMRRTQVYFKTKSNKTISNHANGYVLNRNLNSPVLPDSLITFKFEFYLDQIFGDGAITSTTIDLLKWDQALHGNKLVKKETMNEAYSPHKLTNDSLSFYGFGWEIVSDDSCTGKYVYHTGHWPGYGAYINRFIDKDKTVIVLRNLINYSKQANGIPNVYLDILFNKPFELPTIESR